MTIVSQKSDVFDMIVRCVDFWIMSFRSALNNLKMMIDEKTNRVEKNLTDCFDDDDDVFVCSCKRFWFDKPCWSRKRKFFVSFWKLAKCFMIFVVFSKLNFEWFFDFVMMTKRNDSFFLKEENKEFKLKLISFKKRRDKQIL